MSAEVFLDTNVLVYAFDADAGPKQAIARAAVRTSIAQDSAAISTQVLSEFYLVVTQKIASSMGAGDAGSLIDLFATMRVVETDVPLVRQAIDTQQRHRVSFWDALILAAAERAGCARVLSEDLASGQTYGGVAVENPSV
jgi:predicted nucleic acid-binding protein